MGTSTLTTPIACRLPNNLADRIRQEAQASGDTISAVAGRYIRQAIDDGRATQLRGSE